MLKNCLIIGVAILAVVGMSQAAQVSVGINFGSAVTDGGSHVMAAGTSAGVAAVAQTNWNNYGGSDGSNMTSGIVNNSGAATTVSITNVKTTAPWSANANGLTGGDKTLMGAGLSPNPAYKATVNLTGIAYANYDIYVYTITGNGNQGNWTTNVSLGGAASGNGTIVYDQKYQPTSYLLADLTTTPSTIANVAVFHVTGGTSANALTITDWFTQNGNNTGLAGIQIVQVPEPATMCLLVIGGIGALLRRKR